MATITKPYPVNFVVDSDQAPSHVIAITHAGIDKAAPRISVHLGGELGGDEIHVRVWAKRAPAGMREDHAAIPRSLAYLLTSIVDLGPGAYTFAFRWTDGAPFSEADLEDTAWKFIWKVTELAETAEIAELLRSGL